MPARRQDRLNGFLRDWEAEKKISSVTSSLLVVHSVLLSGGIAHAAEKRRMNLNSTG
jgi:hypothetical protein